MWEKLKSLFLRKGMKKETPREDALSFRGEAEVHADKDPFLHSLQQLSRADIPLARAPRVLSREEKVRETLRISMLVLSCAVFIGSIVYLIDNFAQKARAEALYGEMAAEFAATGLDFGFSVNKNDTAVGADAPTNGTLSLSVGGANTSSVSLTEFLQKQNFSGGVTITTGKYDDQMEKLRSLLRNYQNENEDVFGYISIPSVDINYVTVQGEDNDYYLNHTYKGEYLVVGSIYMDYRCDRDPINNYNTVLYGHNIERPSGIMFHRVTDFFNEETFKNELIYIYTMDGVYVYKPFSVYDTRPDSGYIRTSFATKEEFVSFCTEMQGRSDIASDVVFDGDEHLLTLSTCTNRNNGRYALHAYLVEYIT